MPVRRTRRRIGMGFKDFINKAGNWLKKTQILSKLGSVVAPMAGAYAPIAGQAVGALSKAGYGRRRIRRRGGALRPVGARRGGMLVPVGGSRMSRALMGRPMPRRMPMKF